MTSKATRGNSTVVSRTRSTPVWSDVKVALAQFDRTGLLGLIKDLHALNGCNQAFLHARLGLGADPLTPYKKSISRWIFPDFLRGQDISVAKAKKAISEYKKAIGLPAGVAELSVFYCEQAAALVSDCGIEDEGYFNALVRMFDQALALATALPESERGKMMPRLDAVRSAVRNVGCGVADALNELWVENAEVG